MSDEDIPDTIQYCFFESSSYIWRIKTFWIDKDIHIHKFSIWNIEKSEKIEFILDHMRKHYGDILVSIKILNFSDLWNEKLISEILKDNNLNTRLEINENFSFWNPSNDKYETISKPHIQWKK